MNVVKSFVLALLMCAAFAEAANWQPAQTDPNQCLKPQKILFIGNSYIFSGSYVDMFAREAKFECIVLNQTICKVSTPFNRKIYSIV